MSQLVFQRVAGCITFVVDDLSGDDAGEEAFVVVAIFFFLGSLFGRIRI